MSPLSPISSPILPAAPSAAGEPSLMEKATQRALLVEGLESLMSDALDDIDENGIDASNLLELFYTSKRAEFETGFVASLVAALQRNQEEVTKRL